ncbi:unnamed protein product [Dovyalis caffra]|uniref:Glycosyltransferase n=1 Tax=Dovyalis caffra TaxID=77055 RepID=A0AAV1SHR4_9ROSI|nr:unnamed protein product [Dovyalis caffra]
MAQPHILLVTFPSQGHINPSLQFAKRLIGLGTLVTFATSISAFKRMAKTPERDGLSFATYSDGYDNGFPPDGGMDGYMAELKRRGSETLADLIESSKKKGCFFNCVVYTVFIPWVAEVARQHHIPSTLLWNQPAFVFDIYYYYFNGYKDVMEKSMNDPSLSIEPFKCIQFRNPALQVQLQILSEETNPKILVNTFDALEPEALRAIDKFNLIGAGPLIPSAFLDGKDPSDTSFGGDLFQVHQEDEYVKWLNSKDKSSVIYLSFGSIYVLSKRQMEEIAHGLLDSGRPFLWVIRGMGKEGDNEEEKLSRVPMVAFPLWSDQLTIAKLIQDVWKTGVRVAKNEEGIVEGDEIKRCLDSVIEEKRERMRKNAKEWKDLAMAATKKDGSSDNNLRGFVDDIGKVCC